MSGEMMTGTVKKWIGDRGFGFIVPQSGGDDVFCHVRQIEGGNALEVGATVSYTMGMGRSGKPCAENVTGEGVINVEDDFRGGGGGGGRGGGGGFNNFNRSGGGQKGGYGGGQGGYGD